MDNIKFKKTYQEDNLINIKVFISSKFVNIWQDCYVSCEELIEHSKIILNFINIDETESYVEFGDKTGQCTPSFSMKFEKVDSCGHIRIEMDMEIEDNTIRKHRCQFYIKTEYGLFEKFANSLVNLATNKECKEISLT